MSKKITQEEFDEEVRSLLEDLCLDEQEAIEDVVREYEMKEVDLSNINTRLFVETRYKHLLTCLEQLDKAINENNNKCLPKLLQDLRIQLDNDIKYKVYAGKNKCYHILLKILIIWEDEFNSEVFNLALEAITSLMTGYPDLLDDEGIAFQIRFLDTMLYIEKNKPSRTIVQCLHWIRECCIKHEQNRQKIFHANVFDRLKQIITCNDASSLEIKEACSVIRALILDDDIRHAYGKSHEHAVFMAQTCLDILVNLLKRYKKKRNTGLAGNLMITLAALTVRNDFCEKVADAGGLDCIVVVLRDHSQSQKVYWQALKLLRTLARNDCVKNRIVNCGCAPLIVSVITRHMNCEHIVTAALGCIATLCLRSSGNSDAFYNCDAPPAIVNAMYAHRKNEDVLVQACWAIRNMSVRNRSESEIFLTCDVEKILRDIMSCPNEKLRESAKSALRDLGLHVELKERWTGKGISLSNK
ncbi:armadillo repeat-containing protein 6 homolog [Pseudomyrmex gracilis]|uniref:armadillo repeat-containing protein 6 homolog n=1 Tax=Pseudomyrmex gracilis TaxID=219809 RepID=UPI0009952567|nr:armadillo repeat-containing protein 6 homolog [Pseudomyrmex gracilis]